MRPIKSGIQAAGVEPELTWNRNSSDSEYGALLLWLAGMDARPRGLNIWPQRSQVRDLYANLASIPPMTGLTLGGHIHAVRPAWWVVRNQLRERLPRQELAGRLRPCRVHRGVRLARVPPESARVPRRRSPPGTCAPSTRDIRKWAIKTPVHFGLTLTLAKFP